MAPESWAKLRIMLPIGIKRKGAGVGAALLSGIVAFCLAASDNKGQLSPTFSAFVFDEDQPCPGNPEGQRNLGPSDIPPQILPYLEKHNIPTKKAALCRYLGNLQTLHNARIEDGFIDMAGDYFMTSQNDETRAYLRLKYAFPNNAIDKEKLAKGLRPLKSPRAR